jgi:hypothetical protein
MANVNIQLGYKDSAWFTANATLVLLAGQVVYLQQTGQYKIGNGVTQLSALAFLGSSVIATETQLVTATVVNKTGVNLLASNYQAVKVSTAQGQRLAVDFAQANNDNNSADTIGLVRENISNNQEGNVVILGQIVEVNTTGSLQGETWTDGDVLYLSPTVAGRITNIKPTGLTGHTVIIGYVEYAHAIHGKIYTKIMNGWEVEELHNVADVSYTTPIDADSLLIKDSTASLWKRLTWANLKANLFTLGNLLIGNASATNQRQVRIGQDTTTIDIGSGLGVFSTYSSIYFNQTTPSQNNFTLAGTSNATQLNAGSGGVGISYLGNNQMLVTGSYISFTPSSTSTTGTPFRFTSPTNTNQTASTNIPNFRINGSNKQWATGALTEQYFNYFTTNTISFVGASTATDVYNLFVESPTVGTNATVTNNYSLGTNGKAKFGGNIELTQTVTTETVTSDTTVTIKINGVNYKLLAKS